jgi:hypothetical protein
MKCEDGRSCEKCSAPFALFVFFVVRKSSFDLSQRLTYDDKCLAIPPRKGERWEEKGTGKTSMENESGFERT